MDIVHEHTATRKGASSHRPGGIRFLSLLQGEEGTPGNFQLTLVYAQDFVTPRHRHNFDQVRIVLEGEFGFGPGLVQKAGTWGYFPEGTWYTQRAPGPSTTLLLQSGGTSGSGYMSDRQLRGAVDDLQARGTFHDGVYTWFDDRGKKHNQDGYEAAWEHVHGRPITYPRPLYEQPVLWQAERFDWAPAGQAGVWIRRFGEFTGRRLSLAEVRVDAGATATLSASQRQTLAYCASGRARIGAEVIGPVSAVRLHAGEQVTVAAEAPTHLYLFGLMW